MLIRQECSKMSQKQSVYRVFVKAGVKCDRISRVAGRSRHQDLIFALLQDNKPLRALYVYDATASLVCHIHWRRGMEQRADSKPVIRTRMAADGPTGKRAKQDCESVVGRSGWFYGKRDVIKVI